MPTIAPTPREHAFDAATAQAERQMRGGNPLAALTVLRDAHILGQQDFGRHGLAHWRMLRAALALGDRREVVGQLLRLLLVPLGHLSGRLPIGNPGTADVSAFAPQPIPPRLQGLIDGGGARARASRTSSSSSRRCS
jgi:hypothetical protein